MMENQSAFAPSHHLQRHPLLNNTLPSSSKPLTATNDKHPTWQQFPRLSPEQARLLGQKPICSPLEQQALEYYRIEQWYGQPLTPELYHFDDQGRQRKRLEFLETILPPILTPEFGLRWTPVLPTPATPTVQLLWDIQFYPFLVLALSGGEWHEYTPLLRAFTDSALGQILAVAQHLGVKLEARMPPCSVAGRFLDRCGLKTTSVQCRRIVTPTGALLRHPAGKKQAPDAPHTQRIRIYRLEPHWLQQTWSILQRRQQRRQEVNCT